MGKLIKYDLIHGGKKNIIKYAITVIFVIFVCNQLSVIVQNKINNGLLQPMETSMGDFLLYYFSGIKEYIAGPESDYKIPYIWMARQLLICSFVFSYPIKDVYESGNNILIQYGSRIKWWLSKCIWSLIQVVLYYIIVLCTICIYSMFNGNVNLSIHVDLFCVVDEIVIIMDYMNPLLIIPDILYSFFMSMLLITLTLLITNIASIIIVTLLNIVTAFIMNEYLLANVSMMYRSCMITDRGINICISCGMCIFFSIVLGLVALLYFRKYDIIQKKEI